MIPMPAIVVMILVSAPPQPKELAPRQPRLNETVHRISPKPLPGVLLGVTLIPEQTAAGDALPLYLAAAQLLPRYSPERGKLLEAAYRITGISPGAATPAELETLRQVVEPTADALRLIERAAKVRICDWSGLVPPPPAGLSAAIGELLPTVQAWRELAAALKFRASLRLAAKDYPGALADARTIYGLARHVGQAETLIQTLIGSAIKNIADGLVRQAIDAGGPNLLAALLEFPRPLIPFAPAGRRELFDLTSVLPPLSAIDRKALTAAEANAQLAAMNARSLAIAGPSEGAGVEEPSEEIAQLVAAFAVFGTAPDVEPTRKRLATRGYDSKLLAAMPPAQVHLLDATLRLRRDADRRRLGFTVPPGHPLLAGPAADPDGPAAVVARLLDLSGTAVEKCLIAEAHQSQSTLALALAEALRAALAEPGATWGPGLLGSPLVKAIPAGLPVAWDEAREAFTAPGANFQLYVWERAK